VITQRHARYSRRNRPGRAESDHVLYEELETRRKKWRHDIEPSAAPLVNHSSMTSATCSGCPRTSVSASAAESTDELANSQVLTTTQFDDE